jgi:EmrB/QacA subfamily drug resistance transporter
LLLSISPFRFRRLTMKKNHYGLIIFLISIASFMGTLDATIVNISLPSIARYFQVDIALVSWVALMYLLILSSVLITFGRVGDVHGYRRIYILGFVVFSMGSLCCGLAPHIFYLIGFRAVQAIGASMLQAIGGAMVIRYLPDKKRGIAIGLMTTAAAIGLAVGTPLGGFLSQNLSWHWIFYVNVPVGIAAIIIALIVLPKDNVQPAKEKFDLLGAGSLFLALGTMIFFLNMGNNLGWISWIVLSSIAISVIMWIVFFSNERKAANPIINLQLFKNIDFSLACIVSLLIFLVTQGSFYILPFYFELQRHLTPSIAGIILLLPSIGIMICGPIAGILSNRVGYRPICIVASFIFVGAFLMLSLLGESTGLTFIIIALALEGIGIGLMVPPNFSMILFSSPSGDEGMINSLVSTLRNMGMVMGIALFGLVFLSIVSAGGISLADTTPGSIPQSAHVPGFHATFILGTIVTVIILVLNFILRENKKYSGQRG